VATFSRRFERKLHIGWFYVRPSGITGDNSRLLLGHSQVRSTLIQPCAGSLSGDLCTKKRLPISQCSWWRFHVEWCFNEVLTISDKKLVVFTTELSHRRASVWQLSLLQSSDFFDRRACGWNKRQRRSVCKSCYLLKLVSFRPGSCLSLTQVRSLSSHAPLVHCNDSTDYIVIGCFPDRTEKQGTTDVCGRSASVAYRRERLVDITFGHGFNNIYE